MFNIKLNREKELKNVKYNSVSIEKKDLALIVKFYYNSELVYTSTTDYVYFAEGDIVTLTGLEGTICM